MAFCKVLSRVIAFARPGLREEYHRHPPSPTSPELAVDMLRCGLLCECSLPDARSALRLLMVEFAVIDLCAPCSLHFPSQILHIIYGLRLTFHPPWRYKSICHVACSCVPGAPSTIESSPLKSFSPCGYYCWTVKQKTQGSRTGLQRRLRPLRDGSSPLVYHAILQLLKSSDR